MQRLTASLDAGPLYFQGLSRDRFQSWCIIIPVLTENGMSMGKAIAETLVGLVILMITFGGMVLFLKRKIKFTGRLTLALLFFGALGFGNLGLAVDDYLHAVPRWDAIADGKDVERFFVGTWIYAEPLEDGVGYAYGWQKWVIHQDGSVAIYKAMPSDFDWGKSTSANYELISGKYADTGKRYYGIHLIGSTMQLIVSGEDTGALHDGGLQPVTMKRGDSNPFSR